MMEAIDKSVEIFQEKERDEDWHSSKVASNDNRASSRINIIGLGRSDGSNQNSSSESLNSDNGLNSCHKELEKGGEEDTITMQIKDKDNQITVRFTSPTTNLEDIYIENYVPKVDKKKRILNAVGQWAGVTIDKETTDIVSLVETRRTVQDETFLNRSLSIFWTNSMTNIREFLEQMTLGMRLAVQISKNQTANQPFTEKDFEEVTTHEIYNPKRKVKFTVMEYAPQVFRALRERCFNISEEDFIDEWTLNEEDLKAKEGAGRSGALFLFSRSRRFICKTIFKSEVFTLISFLSKFYQYVLENPNTLIMRLIGLYKFGEGSIAIGAEDVYVLAFNNVLWSDYLPDNQLKLHEVYDLKGRLTKTFRFHEESEVAENEVRKDKHLSRLFYLGNWRDDVFQQLRNDVYLLRDSNLMDYSLLIGVHKVEDSNALVDLVDPHHPCVFGNTKFRLRHGGVDSFKEVFFIGIIDCLTFYGVAKKMAHSFKSILWQKDQLSTVEANFYAMRFLSYMEEIFPEGSPKNGTPFLPCAATKRDEDIEFTVYALRQAVEKSAKQIQMPISEYILSKSDYSTPAYHQLQVENSMNAQVNIKVKEYSPLAFAVLREIFHVSTEDFIRSWNIPLLQLQATVQEIDLQTFLPSSDKRFLYQTVLEKDIINFMSILEAYVDYMKAHSDQSCLVKIVGLFKIVKFPSVFSQYYIIVMLNPFYSKTLKVDEVFDLQGVVMMNNNINNNINNNNTNSTNTSDVENNANNMNNNATLNTSSIVTNINNNNNTIIQLRHVVFGYPIYKLDKDILNDRKFCMGSKKEALMRSIERDIQFLKDNHMIMYRILIGVGKDLVNVDSNEVEENEVESIFGLSDQLGDDESRVMVAGITCLWKKFGRKEFFALKSKLLFKSPELLPIVDQSYYADRFFNLVDQILI